MKRLTQISVFIACLLASVTGYTQGTIKVTATLDTNVILIGDQINLLLEVTHNTKNVITFPVFFDTIVEGVEVFEKSPIDTIRKENNDTMTFRQNLVITSFDSGFYAIPPFRFLLNQDTANYVETEPMLLEVQTIPVKMEEDIKDIKDPLTVPVDWKQYAMYVGIGLVAIIILGLILFFILTKKKPAEIVSGFTQRKPLPPHEIALAKLQTLKDKKLWQNGRVKEYHSEISEILREYLEAQLRFNAMEQVTDEIMVELENRVNEDVQRKARTILQLSDLAKFAKFEPLPDENEQSLNFAVDIVNATKPVVLPEEKSKGDVQ